MADSKKQLEDLRAMYESVPEDVQQKFLRRLANELKEKMPCYLRGTELELADSVSTQICPECTTVVTSNIGRGDGNSCHRCRRVWCHNHYDILCDECDGCCPWCIRTKVVCLDEECQAVLHCIYDVYHCPECNVKYDSNEIWGIEEPLTKAAQ